MVRSLQSQINDIITLPATTNTLVDQSSQTEEISLDDIKDRVMPLISTRKKTNRKGSKQARLVSPAYLQSGALMMSIATMSSSQAVMAMKIHDETVYRQTRHMPLILNKKYKRKLKLLKKYQSLKSNNYLQDVPDDAVHTGDLIDVDKLLDEDDEVLSDDDQHDEVVTIETEETLEEQVDTPDDFAPAAKKAKIDELQKSISAHKFVIKNNLDQVLPDPRSVRSAHHNIATHLEGKIANQMIDSNSSFLMPDGTSRQRLGRLGASLVFIEGQVRALKCQLLGNETRDNWADTIIHNLKRLSMSSGQDIIDIFKTIQALISDSCKVNKGLADVISGKLGIAWVPGTLYCCLHTVL